MPIPPVLASISGEYHAPRPTKERPGRRHYGVDYSVARRTPVRASAKGVVVISYKHSKNPELVVGKDGKTEEKFIGSYGNVIIIDHTPPDAEEDMRELKSERKYTYTLYAHLDRRNVPEGKVVKQGDTIGSSGRTGTAQEYYNRKGGFHLHFEVIESRNKIVWRNSKNIGHPGHLDRMSPRKFFRRSFGHVFEPFVTPGMEVLEPFVAGRE